MTVDLKSLTFSLENLDSSINYEWADGHYEEDIDVKYFVDYARELGRGYNSVVRKCIRRDTGKRYAVKSLKKTDVDQLETAKRDAATLALLDHPSIIKVHETYGDKRYFHVVTEMCKGRDLFEKVKAMAKRGENYSEHETAIILRQLVDAVAYCHDKNIVHRDLKLENILLTSKKNGETEIKLIDFGLCVTHDILKDEPLTERVGTPLYVAPEVLDGEYDRACDLWSIGVVAYALLTGSLPFTKTADVRSNKPVEFPFEDWDGISKPAKDFVQSLLNKEAYHRLTAAEALQHEWLQNSSNATVEAPKRRRRGPRFAFFKKTLSVNPNGRIVSNAK